MKSVGVCQAKTHLSELLDFDRDASYDEASRVARCFT